jgi:hypothetical protein
MAENAVAVVVSLLAPDGAPESLLLSDAVAAFLALWPSDTEAGSARVLRPDAARRGLRDLARAGLLIHDPAAVAREIRMAPRAQRDILEDADPELVAAAVRACADGLMQTRPGTHANSESWHSWRSNVRCLSTRRPRVLWQPQGHPVLFVLGGSLVQAGLVDEARAFWQTTYEDAVSYLGADHPHTMAARAVLDTPLTPDAHLPSVLKAHPQ